MMCTQVSSQRKSLLLSCACVRNNHKVFETVSEGHTCGVMLPGGNWVAICDMPTGVIIPGVGVGNGCAFFFVLAPFFLGGGGAEQQLPMASYFSKG